MQKSPPGAEELNRKKKLALLRMSTLMIQPRRKVLADLSVNAATSNELDVVAVLFLFLSVCLPVLSVLTMEKCVSLRVELPEEASSDCLMTDNFLLCVHPAITLSDDDVILSSSEMLPPAANEKTSTNEYCVISSVNSAAAPSTFQDVTTPPSGANNISKSQGSLSFLFWKIHLSGLLWLILRHLRKQGHVGVNRADLREMEKMFPSFPAGPVLLPIVLCTIQTLSTMAGGHEIFATWFARDGRIVVTEEERQVTVPRISPWKMEGYWSCDTWAILIEIINRFLAQGVPSVETKFYESLADLCLLAGDQSWVIEVAVHVLYFLQTSSYFWPTLFRK